MPRAKNEEHGSSVSLLREFQSGNEKWESSQWEK